MWTGVVVLTSTLIISTLSAVVVSLINKKKPTGNEILFQLLKNVSAWEPVHYPSAEEYASLWNPSENTDLFTKLRTKIPVRQKVENVAVVHFRCSDQPFRRHPSYVLQPKSYFKFVSKEIEARDVDSILIVTCDKHERSELAHKCSEYSSAIKDWLGEFTHLPVNIDDTCMSVKETYQLFVDCKVLVSTGGSFSFLPGMTKGVDFISPSLLGSATDKDTREKFKDLYKLVSWTMWDRFEHVPHSVLYETYDYKHDVPRSVSF